MRLLSCAELQAGKFTPIRRRRAHLARCQCHNASAGTLFRTPSRAGMERRPAAIPMISDCLPARHQLYRLENAAGAPDHDRLCSVPLAQRTPRRLGRAAWHSTRVDSRSQLIAAKQHITATGQCWKMRTSVLTVPLAAQASHGIMPTPVAAQRQASCQGRTRGALEKHTSRSCAILQASLDTCVWIAHRRARRSRSALWTPGAVSAWQLCMLPGRCCCGPMASWLDMCDAAWPTDGASPCDACEAMRRQVWPAGNQNQRAAGTWELRRSVDRCAGAMRASAERKSICSVGPAL